MKKLVLSAVVLVVVAGISSYAGAQSKPEGDGWVSLFNGKDFTGWVLPKKDHTWQVLDGVMDYEAKGGHLVTEKEYSDYVLHIEWRFKRTEGKPYNAKLYNPDGTQKKDANGKPMTKPVKNADSGIYLRGTGKTQVNLWCWPCGSGQMWAFQSHKDPKVRAGAIPKMCADKPVGEWNTMEITLIKDVVTVVLNGKTVMDKSMMPGIPERGPITLQHHGGYNEKNKTWSSASALTQFRNIWIKELK